MAFATEWRTLRSAILHLGISILLLSAFFFFFGFTNVKIGGILFPFPVPDKQSFSAILFEKMKNDLMPDNVELVVTNPISAFVSQALIATLLSLLLTLPYFLYKITTYMIPALHLHERKLLSMTLFPSMLLFLLGAFFAYTVIIPPTLSFLYTYASAIGATLLFSVPEFISLVFSIVIVTGVSFLLPVFMFLLSRIGLTPEHFWKKQWRYALISFLLFSAIITPDGSGVSMAFLSLPLVTLYLVGIIISK